MFVSTKLVIKQWRKKRVYTFMFWDSIQVVKSILLYIVLIAFVCLNVHIFRYITVFSLLVETQYWEPMFHMYSGPKPAINMTLI